MNIRDFIQTKTGGRYEQITEMAQEEGGFGRLYRALDSERQNREVCIKVIKPHLSKELQIKLWHDEVQALELYRNRSGIVHLVDKQYEFTDDDPYWFLVMEYVHGKRLGASKYRIDLDVEEEQAIRLIFQLCSVIYSIHQRGKYHQDIFPDNIKIQGEDVILLDLGGMREAERRSGTIIFGGEMYSPPEVSPTRLRMKRFRALRKQKMGSFESADMFSIGALCYELIMGESFFQNIEQSNQLKEYIYDYYVDPETLKRMKREYQEALGVAQRRTQQFSQYLNRLNVSPELQNCLTRALAIHPQKRPTIEEMLDAFLPFMLQRAKAAHHDRHWTHVILWIRHVEQHFDEIRIESTDADVAFKQKMQAHLVKHASMYVETCLVRGMAQFHQELFEAAQRNFLKTHEVLDLYQDGYSVQQRNAYLLKVTNNVAACLYQRNQKHEALHLLKTLSTAHGKFGQIISHNIQICAA